MSATPASVTAYQCPECTTIYDQSDLVPIYECSRCSQASIERRCEDDNIFMACAGEGCESCAVEAEQVEAVEDHDGQLILLEDWDPEGSKTDRDAADAAQRQKERAEQDRREKEARDAASEAVPVSSLAVGDWIINPQPYDWDPDNAVQVKAILRWGGDTLGLAVAEFGMPQVYPVAPDRECTRVPPENSIRRQEAPFGSVTFDPDGGRMSMSSAPGKEEYSIELAHVHKRVAPWGQVPCMVVSRYTPGLLNVIGVFIDREHAESALTVWESAGRALAGGRGVDPVASGHDVVQVAEKPYSTYVDNLGREVEFTLGISEWDDTDLPSLNVRTSGSNATVQAAGPLLAAVEVARNHLGHLDRNA